MLRSLLFIPAREKMLKKLEVLHSDGYIIDLEDSVRDEEKEVALNATGLFLSEHKDIPHIFVRLNKDNYIIEAKTLDQFNIGFMLPKFEKPEDYRGLEDIWERHSLIALVESPLGIVKIHDIVQCSWVDALAFGAEDFTASTNMTNKDDILLPIKTTIVIHAKAYKKKIYDTPSFSISDQSEFEKEVSHSASLGFDGKLLIHPKQIETVNKYFSEKDIDSLSYLVAEYEKRGEAVTVIDGKIYEKMHIDRFRRIIKEHNNR